MSENIYRDCSKAWTKFAPVPEDKMQQNWEKKDLASSFSPHLALSHRFFSLVPLFLASSFHYAKDSGNSCRSSFRFLLTAIQ